MAYEITEARWRGGWSHEDHLGYGTDWDALLNDSPDDFRSVDAAISWAEKWCRKYCSGDAKYAHGLELVVTRNDHDSRVTVSPGQRRKTEVYDHGVDRWVPIGSR